MSNMDPKKIWWLNRILGTLAAVLLFLIGLPLLKVNLPDSATPETARTMGMIALLVLVVAVTVIWTDWGKKK